MQNQFIRRLSVSALVLHCIWLGNATESKAVDFVYFVDTTNELGGAAFGYDRDELVALLNDDAEAALEAALASLETVAAGRDFGPLVKDLKVLKSRGSSRFTGGLGDRLLACAVHPVGTTATVSAKEESRLSQIAKDLKKLGSILGAAVAALPTQPPVLTCSAFRLEEGRATVTVAAKVGTTEKKAVVTTGSKEHLFISVDLPVSEIEEIKYNDTLGRLETKKTPASFYAGVNYLFGDLAGEHSSGAVAKLLLSASRKPLDSVGVAIAWRFPNTAKGDFKLNSFSPFVGYVWTTSDSVDAAGAVERSSGRDGEVVFGLSFNLDAGADWLKKAVSK